MDRRSFLKIVGGAVIGGAIGVVGGWYAAGQAAVTETITKTLFSTTTVTETKTVKSVVATTPTTITAPQVESGTLRLFTWEEEGTSDFLNPFREKYPQVNLEVSFYGEQDEMLAKLQAGYKADVIAPCSDYIKILKDLDLIRPIDTGLLENWKDLFPELKEAPGVKIDGEVYFVPSNIGTEGILYRTDKIDREITSWNDLWDPAFKGHVLMEDYAKMSIAIAALALGYKNPWHLNKSQLQEVKEKLLEQKPLVLKYSEEPDVEVVELMSAGDVWISVGWRPEEQELLSEGVPVKYVAPVEGELVFMCGNSIIKGTEMPVAAHKLVDNYIAPHSQMLFADPEEFGYWITNKRVVEEMLDPQIVEQQELDKVAEALEKGVFEEAVENYDLWLDVWEEVLAA